MSKNKKVTIIDYGSGNLWSVKNALIYLGFIPEITSDPEKIIFSNKLILPGVGSFAKAMQAIKKNKIDEAIIEAVSNRRVPILGICLGMQILGLGGTEESITKGIGLIPTRVEPFNKDILNDLKTPHIGFNTVLSHPKSILFNGIGSRADFYFVHSYRMLSKGIEGHNGTCLYGEDFMACYENENIFATQFHPEKSQTNGLIMLNNFLTS
jgi:imidazole glycerol-phosphate synthase subunit HisH